MLFIIVFQFINLIQLKWIYPTSFYSPQKNLAGEGYVHDLSLRPLASAIFDDEADESTHKHTDNGGHGKDIFLHESLELAAILFGSRHDEDLWIGSGSGQPWVLLETPFYVLLSTIGSQCVASAYLLPLI